MKAVLLLALLPCLAAASTTLTVRPAPTTANSGDTYTTEDLPSTNFGGAGALAVSGTANAKGPLASLLRFDLATVTSALDASYGPGGWVVDSILLELTAATPINPNFNPNAAGDIAVQWLSDDSWLESGVTWSSLPGIVSGGEQSMGSFTYSGALGTAQYLLVDSAGFLADLQAGGQASLLLSASDPAASLVVNSRNHAITANRPALIIIASAVPEPSRVCLLLAGLALLSQNRRRTPGG